MASGQRSLHGGAEASHDTATARRGEDERVCSARCRSCLRFSCLHRHRQTFYECSLFSCKTPIWDVIYYCWSLIDAICFLHNLTGEFAEAFSSLFEGCRNDYCTYMTDQIRRTPELSHAYRRNINMVSGLNAADGSDVKFYHLFSSSAIPCTSPVTTSAALFCSMPY